MDGISIQAYVYEPGNSPEHIHYHTSHKQELANILNIGHNTNMRRADVKVLTNDFELYKTLIIIFDPDVYGIDSTNVLETYYVWLHYPYYNHSTGKKIPLGYLKSHI